MNAAPSRALSAAAAAAVLLVFAPVALPGDGVPAFFIRISEFVLAGGAAYLLDDAAVVLTAVTPTGLWRRRLPRIARGVGVLAAAWVLILTVLRWHGSLPPVWLVTAELVVLCLSAAAAAAVLARSGEAEPGSLVAPAVGLLGITAVLAEPVLRWTVFVPWDGSGGAGVRVAWVVCGVLAVVVLARASRDPARGSQVLWVRSPRRRSTDSGSA